MCSACGDTASRHAEVLSFRRLGERVLSITGGIADVTLDNEVISQDLDAVTILDKFVREHPDFSPFGAKGSLSLTGCQGILGYPPYRDNQVWDGELEANRLRVYELV